MSFIFLTRAPKNPTLLYPQRRWKVYLFVCSWIHLIDGMSGDRYTLANKNYRTVAPVEYSLGVELICI